MIIAVPRPNKPNIVGATHREVTFPEDTYPMEDDPTGGRLSGRVPFSVIRLLDVRSLGGFPILP